MSWVLISLRKKELKRTHADYVAEDLQISRQLRQEARRKSYDQTVMRNEQTQELSELKTSYNDTRDQVNSIMDEIKNAVNEQNKNIGTTDENGNSITKINYDDYYVNGKKLSDYQSMLDEAKEEYLEEQNDIKSYWEDELQMLEEEANDTETVLEQDKVDAETQMEHVSQELSALDQALSTEIQNSTIKLS